MAVELAVEPVLVDAGDQRLLLVEDRLALDDRGERQDLVERQPALRRDVHPVLDASWNLSSMSRIELLGASCRAGRGRSPARGSPRARRPPGRLEPGVVGEELGGRVLGEVVEVRPGPSSSPSIVSSFAVICSSRRPVRRAISTYGIGRRVEQRGHELVGRHRAAQDEVARSGAVRSSSRSTAMKTNARRSREEALLLEAVGDRRGRLAGARP